MKLLKIKEKLEKKQIKKRIIRKEFQNKSRKQDSKLTIIGITGSRGKSTTALMIHNYLKYIGYKSTLYSSVMVDHQLVI